MAWCVECWSQDRRTVAATKVLDAEDLCDLHYRNALGEGLPAVPKNVPPMPPAQGPGVPIAPKNAAPEPPSSKVVAGKQQLAGGQEMAWCVECWSQDRRTEPGTKVLDAEDLCDLHYRNALGEGLPAVPKNVPPMPPAQGPGVPIAPKNAAPEPPSSKVVDIRLQPPVTVSAPLIPPTKTAAEPRTKEKEKTTMSKRLCACGCGEELSPEAKRSFLNGHKPSEKAKRLCGCGCGTALVNRHPYIKGHNPDGKKKATPSAGNGKDKRPLENRGGQQSNGGGAPVDIPLTVTVPLRGEHLDALWGRLSLQEKADKLFPAE